MVAILLAGCKPTYEIPPKRLELTTDVTIDALGRCLDSKRAEELFGGFPGYGPSLYRNVGNPDRMYIAGDRTWVQLYSKVPSPSVLVVRSKDALSATERRFFEDCAGD